MKIYLRLTVGLAFGLYAFGQAADTPFQVGVVSELDRAEAYVTISNSGASSTVALPTQNGAVCANIYVFGNPVSPAASGQLLSCCSCAVPANTTFNAPVKEFLLNVAPSRPLLTPSTVTIKLLATTGAGGCGTPTSPSPTTAGTGANVLVTGMVAYNTSPTILGTNPPAFYPTRIAFTPSTLSAAELARLTTLCGFNQISGNPAGLCKACQAGGH